MNYSQQATHSFWQQDYSLPQMPRLEKSLTTDVCIVSAGIAGLLVGLQLLKIGFRVVILERGYLEKNETGYTSAHLSDALDDGFNHLLNIHGIEKLKKFYHSHTQAIQLIEKIIFEENILCDFQRLPGYLFLDPSTPISYLEKELKAAKLL